MAGLQGRVGMRSGGTMTMPPARNIDLDATTKDAAALLYPLLLESLYPQQFSGNLGLSIHIQEGRIYHIREFITSTEEPGQPGMVSGAGKASASQSELAGENVLQSAIRDLRSRLGPIGADYFGIITLTIEVSRGICKLVQCGRERVYRKTTPR